MSRRLEAAGMQREQASAVIEVVAKAIEKFAVTREVLREEFRKNNELIFQRIDEKFKAQDQRIQHVEERFDIQDQRIEEKLQASEKRMEERFSIQDKRFDRLESLMKMCLGWVFASLVVFVGGLIGLVGVLAGQP